MRTKRKMTAVIICILFAVIFACYGFWMSGNGSGTGFFLIWFVLAALLGGCATITFLDGWARLPMWMLQDDQEHDRGDDQPKRVLRDAAAQIAHDRGGAELADQMITPQQP